MTIKGEEFLFIDGDTVEDKMGGRHRLLGINTMETVHPTKPETIQGHIQKAAMKELAQNARLEDTGELGFHDRHLSNLVNEDGSTVQADLVEAGLTPASYGASKEIRAAETRSLFRDALGKPVNPRLAGFRALSDHYKKTNPIEFTPKDTFKSDGTFKRSIRRGADNMQSSLYAFGNVMGNLFGSETIKEWSAKGIERNLQEAAVNPLQIENHEHIETFEDFGTYVVETFGEQVPNLLTMVASGGSAAIGKTVAAQLGKGAVARVAANTSMKNAVLAGTVGTNYPMLTGEAQKELQAEGIDSPLTALALGGINTGFETFANLKLIDKYLDAYKASGSGMADLLKSVGVATVGQGFREGATEVAQSMSNKLGVAAHKDDYNPLSEKNLVELIDAGLRGGLVGAGLGGSAHVAGVATNKAFGKKEEEMLRLPAPTEPETGMDQQSEQQALLALPPGRKGEWERHYDDPQAEFDGDLTPGVFDFNDNYTLEEEPEFKGIDFSQYSTDSLMDAFNTEQPDPESLSHYESRAYDANHDALFKELERRDAFEEFDFYESDALSPTPVDHNAKYGHKPEHEEKEVEAEFEDDNSLIGVPSDYLFPDQVDDVTNEGDTPAVKTKDEWVEETTPEDTFKSGQDKNLVGKSGERDVNELLGIAKGIAEERSRKAEEANVPKKSNIRSPFDADETANSEAPVFDNIDDDGDITDSQDEDTRDFRTSATREESDIYLGRQTKNFEKGEQVEQKDKMGRLRRHKLSHDDISNLSDKNARRQGYSSREAAEKFAKEQIREGKNYPEYADIKDDPDAIKVIKKKGRYFIKISPRPEMFNPGSKISAFDVRMDDENLFRVAAKKAVLKLKSVKEAVSKLNKSQSKGDLETEYNQWALIKGKDGYINLPYLVSLMRSYKQTSSTDHKRGDKRLREDVINTLAALYESDMISNAERKKMFSRDSHDGLTDYSRKMQVSVDRETGEPITIRQMAKKSYTKNRRTKAPQIFSKAYADESKAPLSPKEHDFGELKEVIEQVWENKNRSLIEDEVGTHLQEEILPTSTKIKLPHKEKQAQLAGREKNTLLDEGDGKGYTREKVRQNTLEEEATKNIDPSTKESLSEKEMESIKRSNGDNQTVYDLTRKSDNIQTDKERLKEADERAAKHEAQRVEDENNLKRIVKGLTGRQNLTVSDKGFSPRDKNFIRVALESIPELKKVKLLVMTKSDFMGTAFFKDHKFTPMAIKRARKFMNDNPEVRGQTIPVGDSAIIIVDDIHSPATNQAQGERLLVLGHELGHVVFNQIKNNLTNGQQARLTKMHRESKSELDQEEWFSDQVSALIKDRSGKALPSDVKKGIISETAEKVIKALNKLWKALSKAMASRFTLDENFDKWMTRSVLPKADLFSDNIGYDYTREFTMEKPKRVADKAYRTLKKVFTKDLAPMYLTAHRQLLNMGQAGEKLARMFHVENGTAAGRLGWLDVKDTESAYRSKRFMDLLPEGQHEEFLQGYTDMITAKEETLSQDFRDTVFQQYDGVGNEKVYGLDILRQFAKSSRGDKRTALVKMVMEAIPGKSYEEKVAFAKDYLTVPAKYRSLDNEMRSHYQYLNKSMGGKMARMQYFFPRMYDVNALMENKDGFISLITKEAYVVINKEGEKEHIDHAKAEAIWKALTSNEGMDADGFFVDQGLKTPSLDNKKHRTLRDIPDNILREFLVKDDIRLMKYVSASTKRAEYESRAGGRTNIQQLFTKMKKQIAQGREIDTDLYGRVAELAKEDKTAWAEYEKKRDEGKDVAPPTRKQYWDPNHKVDELIQSLPEEDRNRARLIMDSYLGRLGLDMNPTMDKIQQVFAAVQLTTTLLFATLASLQDPAGIAIKTGEWKSLPKIAGHMYKAVKNKADYDQMSRTIGVVQDETVGKILAELYGMNYIDPKIQKVTDAYFKYTGLEWFTKMTRTVGVAMGKDFIRDHMGRIIADGNKTSIDYMERLGLDVENPRVPTDEDFVNDDMFRQGVSKFVDDSILRPNAAQRPAWGSDKRFLLLWQLKSFFYGFGHTILGGMFREAKRVFGNEQGMAKFKAAFPFILAAATLMPIAMLGLELREIVKYGFNPAPTDRMDTDTYFAEIFERAGGLGPMTLATGMFSASEFNGSPVNALLGPTAQHVELLMRDFGAGLERAIPVHSQLKDRMFGFDYNPLR